MHVHINGRNYKLRFRHSQDGRKCGGVPGNRYEKVRLPKRMAVGALRSSRPRGVTTCEISEVVAPRTAGGEVRLAEGIAFCSSSESSYGGEFGRQLSLARALVKLPRRLAAPLMGAYLKGRLVLNLHEAIAGDVGRLDALPDALRFCPDTDPARVAEADTAHREASLHASE